MPPPPPPAPVPIHGAPDPTRWVHLILALSLVGLAGVLVLVLARGG